MNYQVLESKGVSYLKIVCIGGSRNMSGGGGPGLTDRKKEKRF